MALNVGELVAFLKLDDKQFKGGMDKARSSMEGLGSKIGGLLATGAMAAVTALAAASVAAAKLGVDYNAMLETSRAKWTTLLGTQEAAAAQLQWMADFAASTPFEFEELDNAASRLKAFGFTIEQTRSLLGTLGDAAAATGKGTVALDALSNALGKIQGTGKVTTEALNMMSDQGINGFKILAEGIGVSEAKVRDLIEKGVLPAGKAIPILAQGLDKAFGGAMQKQAETFTGRLSTLKDNAKQLLGNVFQPLFEYLSVKAMPKAIALVDDLAKGFKQGGLKGALSVIFPQSMIAYFESLFGLLGDIGKWFGESLPNAGSIGKDIIDGIFIGLKALVDYLRGHKELVVQILAAIGIGFAVLFPIPAAIAAVVVAGALLIKNWTTVKTAALNAWSSIKASIYNAIAGITDKYAKFIGFFSEAKGAEARAAADSLRSQAQAELEAIDERNGLIEGNAQAAADAEEAKALSAWKSSTQRQNAAKQAGTVEQDVWKQTSQAASDSMEKTSEKVKEFTDEFVDQWDKAEQKVLDNFENAQEDATTKFERGQEKRLTAKERELNDEKTAEDRYVEDQMTKFKQDQEDRLIEEKAGWADRRRTRQDELDQELQDFKDTQQAELDAVRQRYDDEAVIRNADLRNALAEKQGEIDAIKEAEEQQQREERRASLEGNITKAVKGLDQAKLTKDPEKILKAEEELAAARKDLSDWELAEQRKAQVEHLRSEMDAIREEYRLKDDAAKEAEKQELAQKTTQQATDLKAEQDRLAGLMRNFEAELAQDELNFTRQQEQDKTHRERELQDIKDQGEADRNQRLENFKNQLEDEKTEWKRQQKQRAEQYKSELDDLHTSFKDKLTEQANFVREWNKNVDRMKSMAPDAGGGATPDTAPASSGSSTTTPATPSPGRGGGGPKMMAKGGILNGPTFVAGEAGREVVSPLDTLWSRIARMAEQVSQHTAASITGGGLADQVQQMAQQMAAMMTGGMQAMPAGVPQYLTVQSVLDGRVVAENTIRHMVPILRPVVRSRG